MGAGATSAAPLHRYEDVYCRPHAAAKALLYLAIIMLLVPPNLQQQHSFFWKSDPSPTHTRRPVQQGHRKKLVELSLMSTPAMLTVTTVPGEHVAHVRVPLTVHILSFPWNPLPDIAQTTQKLMVAAAFALAVHVPCMQFSDSCCLDHTMSGRRCTLKFSCKKVADLSRFSPVSCTSACTSSCSGSMVGFLANGGVSGQWCGSGSSEAVVVPVAAPPKTHGR